jgi:hypothetical protein
VKKPNHISDQKLKRFIACLWLNQAWIFKPKPHKRVAPFFQASAVKTVRVLQSLLTPRKESVSNPGS